MKSVISMLSLRHAHSFGCVGDGRTALPGERGSRMDSGLDTDLIVHRMIKWPLPRCRNVPRVFPIHPARARTTISRGIHARVARIKWPRVSSSEPKPHGSACPVFHPYFVAPALCSHCLFHDVYRLIQRAKQTDVQGASGGI